ncbi:hypothetical protein JXB27_04575 [Candidatus Woesearchaeota archaeon]|nr:hypothetical protein [Candidatus Woesearchaeota archaeon]
MKLKFSKNEWRDIFITIFVISFIFSFTNWGVDKFDAVYGISNLILVFVLVSIAMFGKLFVQKKLANKFGFETEFKPWIFGMILGLFISFISNGKFIFLALGVVTYAVIEHTRLGHRHQLSFNTMAWISILGIFVNVALAAIFRILSESFFREIMMKAADINLWIAFFGILPIPLIRFGADSWWKLIDSSEGLFILYTSRWTYVFAFAFIISSILAIAFLPTLMGFASALVLSAIIWWVYYVTVEQNV